MWTDLVVSNEYHTGLDIGTSAGTVRAATSGFIVKIQENDIGCDSSVRGACEDHGYGNTIIIKHDLGSGIVYSQYSHLASIEESLKIACGRVDQRRRNRRTCAAPVFINAGATLGQVGGSGFGKPNFWPLHLHFEIKDFSTLGTDSDDSGKFGYTSNHPDLEGYHDPILNLHNISPLSPPQRIQIALNGTNLRVGPGGTDVTAYRVFGQVNQGDEYDAAGSSPSTTTPNCPGGWYQLHRVDGSRFPDFFGRGAEIPDAWVCRDFISQQARSCHTFNPGSSILQGFGAPWNVFNTSEVLLQVSCTFVSIPLPFALTAQIGPATYVYNKGYAWVNNQWQQVTFNCTEGQLVSDAWCPQSAQGTLPNNSTHYVAYTCTWRTDPPPAMWKCGCRDLACTQNFWQLQKIN